MDIYLVRHAKAGDRRKWVGPDQLRPLSKKGWKQAERLADLLADRGITRILSSPFVRCVQTVQPHADRLGLKVEETDALAEGASAAEVMGLIRELVNDGDEDAAAVLCTHGDVIPTLLDALIRSDGLQLPEDYPCAKGSTWRLRADRSGRITEAEYLPPPA